MKKYDIAIIGSGIVGASIAYQLEKYELNIIMIEKNIVLANETTNANSGVLHGGFDPEPNKIEARLNVEGVEIWKKEIFKHLKFNRAKIDSLVLAFNDEELEAIDELYERGLKNKVPEKFMKILSREEVIKREPFINKDVKGALIYNDSWAINASDAAKAFIGASIQNGMKVSKNSEVTGINYNNSLFDISINKNEKIQAKIIINAAGHYADEIAKMAGYPDFSLTTKRGEYRILSKTEAHKVNSILFMVPTIHGKGVIVSPMLDGRVMVGPTAEDNIPKEDARLVTRKKFDLIGNIGTKIIPDLKLERTEITYAGSRPIDVKTNDFFIASAKNNKFFINASGMQSPAIAAAPSIALEIEKLILNTGIELKKKTNFKPNFEVLF